MTTVSQPALSETPGRGAGVPAPRRRPAVREDRRTGYALIAPTAVIVLVMVVLPIIWTVLLAFQHVRLINLRQTGFFGRLHARQLRRRAHLARLLHALWSTPSSTPSAAPPARSWSAWSPRWRCAGRSAAAA